MDNGAIPKQPTKIFKLEESGSSSWGFPTLEKYFLQEADARKAFNAKIKEYRKDKHLAKKNDLDGRKSIEIKEKPEPFAIKEPRRKVLIKATASMWEAHQIPEEGTEWDIGSVQLEIIEIPLEEPTQ